VRRVSRSIQVELAAIRKLSRPRVHAGDWVATGAVADAVGAGVVETAARLRGASKRGLCLSRRSLLCGTTWRLTPVGASLVHGTIWRLNSPYAGRTVVEPSDQ
jgi:hypothetical protein